MGDNACVGCGRHIAIGEMAHGRVGEQGSRCEECGPFGRPSLRLAIAYLLIEHGHRFALRLRLRRAVARLRA